ncbi:MAG: EscU/YscU/HrcU family type III secretion system export apparatus switch protein [Betaproteobacteria bacterium]|nr:EscU/YscU/HrcU family type III secretion system export apparatus switch protein [Betaproteobacteria bacterium]
MDARYVVPLGQAAALSYRTGQGAPKVVAKGRGELARRIVELARENGVPVAQSPELVSLLMQVDIDKQIPESLYRAVAEVLVWAHALPAAAHPARTNHG